MFRSSHHLGAMALSLAAASLTAATAAQAGEVCERWHAGPFITQPEGINGQVRAFTVWTPPNGPQLLVAGGDFTSAGGVAVNDLAAWDGASWRSLNMFSFDGAVNSLTVYDGDLIVAGSFSFNNRIMRFDGTQWHAMGAGMNSIVHALKVYNGELYAGGEFTFAGGTPASAIAKWNGTSWSPVGGGVIGGFNVVRAFEIYNNDLIVGGNFDLAGGLGGVMVRSLARWNGSSWAALTGGAVPGVSGLNQDVYALGTHFSQLIIGGLFTQAGGAPANNIASWNGTNWGNFGSGINGQVYTIHSYNNTLIAGGFMEVLGARGVARFNGLNWTGLTGGVQYNGNTFAFDLIEFNNNLIVGGQFTIAGAPVQVPVTNIAQYADGVNWRTLHISPPPVVNAFENFAGQLVVAGAFTQTTDSFPANHIMKWNGWHKQPLHGGFNSIAGFDGEVLSVRALKAYTEPGPFGAHRLIVGGYFTTANGMTANRIAMWSEPVLQAPGWSTMGPGFNGPVHAIERHNSVIFAGGEFSGSGTLSGINNVAWWNGANWVGLGSGMNGRVMALKSFFGELYAGGEFTTAGGVTTGGLARWNGSSWSSVGGFFNGSVYSLEVHDGELVIGGSYPGLPGSPNIAKYSGTTYSTLGTGGTNGPVLSLKSVDGELYMGGVFSLAGGMPAINIARWNSTSGWRSVDGGANAVVLALGAMQSEVQAGGSFSSVGTSGVAAKGWARYTATGVPWVVQQPISQDVDCGATASFIVLTPPGYGVGHQWKKNGDFIGNGPTSHGSTISGAFTRHLVITGATNFDAGVYECLLQHQCAEFLSEPATLTVSCCTGDINGDGQVTIDDMLEVIGSWGVCPEPPGLCLADISPASGDGEVNIDDLLLVIGAWGVCP